MIDPFALLGVRTDAPFFFILRRYYILCAALCQGDLSPGGEKFSGIFLLCRAHTMLAGSFEGKEAHRA